MFRKMIPKVVFIAIFSLALISGQAFADPVAQKDTAKKDLLETTAESAVLIAPDSGEVLFSKNPDQPLPMASVTKIMTLLLAVEAVEQGKARLEDKVVTSENAWGMGGSQIYLEPGEEFSFKEMLISVAVGSANDASVALAEQVEGSEEAFVQKMNERAKQLGCTATNFVNPTGLPAQGHHTSALDLARIMTECIKHPLFMQISGIYEYDLRGGDFKLWNTNKLLKWYNGVDAGKTGWTNEAKYCLASTCERDKLRLIAVVLGTPEPKSHFRESIKLFNYGFARYKSVYIEDSGKVVKVLPVEKGVQEKVGLLTSAKVSVIVKKGEEKGYQGRVETPERIAAPVKKGQKIGDYIVTRDNREVLRVPLVAENNIPKRSFVQQLNKTLRGVMQ
ncbi:MAG: D-Ala-D-Ala carboxypeptidase [Peptococcaceae bacterium BICA1-7]|nr:MAG: D-Ala-D-Ala carboxypeptidase [Peptococcaceae bacterium BICA1-7]HBV96889.1 D-alanyl-D-alanine carboxypeptidase [Desulfotomaculum sp.]